MILRACQGEVYLDEERNFMKALGDRWLGLQVSVTDLYSRAGKIQSGRRKSTSASWAVHCERKPG